MRLYAIADLAMLPLSGVGELIMAAIAGGVTAVQVRGKEVPARPFLEAVEAARRALGDRTVPLIVNDRIDIAVLAGAGGVHVGDQDLPLRAVRRLMPAALLGRTVRSVDGARRAAAEGADYLGVGSVQTSTTKGGAPVIGLEGLALVAGATRLPVVAIGGLDLASAAPAIERGASGVAVAGALFASLEAETRPALAVERRARALRAVVDAALLEHS
jgi:thiamine-phosphate diphosphorylase